MKLKTILAHLKKCLNKHYDLQILQRTVTQKEARNMNTIFNTRCEAVSSSMKSKYISDSALWQPVPWRLAL